MSLKRQRVILVKAETTYGEDANPAPAANAMLVQLSSSISVEGSDNSREHIRPTWSPEATYRTGKLVNLQIVCEVAGGGMDGDDVVVPVVDPLLLACGMCRNGDIACGSVPAGETYCGAEIAALTNTFVYMPRTLPVEHGSCTIYWYQNNMIHKAVGCRGTWSLSMPSGKKGVWTFNMKGRYVAPVAATFPDATLTDPLPPTVQAMGLTYGGQAATAPDVSVELGWTVGAKESVNGADGIAEIRLTDRTPKGSFSPEMWEADDFNPWTAWADGTTQAMTCTLGSAQGNMMRVDVPKAQPDPPSYGERDGLTTYDLSFKCTRDDAGDDEITLTFS